MGIENRITFDADWSTSGIKGLKSYMIFEVSPYDGDLYEDRVEVSCYEDIEMFFKMYLKENWKELFEHNHHNVFGAEFKGFRFIGKEESGHTLNLDIGGRAQAWVYINHDVLNDQNANMIAEIRKIVGK